ncbi:MAG: CDP-alcohol phosphatidyltransferase family protein [Anaerolineales bacterium]|nr:CDP-alcohol phosphatidyltransferase family protein [Anaerolineales bacterium]
MQVNEAVRPRLSLSDRFRKWFKWFLDPTAAFLNRHGVHPNTVSLFGFVGTIVGACLVAIGQIRLGGLVILLMAPIDAIDGSMARQRGVKSRFGAFVDSVTDRYSELVVYFALLVYYTGLGDRMMTLVVFLAAAGSLLVSYIRARAEAVEFDARGGLLSRLERYLILCPAMILGIAHIGIAIIALLANVTAVQRIYAVRRQAAGTPGAEHVR